MKNKLIKSTVGISLLSFGILLTSCDDASHHQLATPAKTKYVSTVNMDKDDLDSFYSFNGRLANLLYKQDNNNFCISPLSIYMGLSMLEGVTNDTNCAQIEKFVGIDKDKNQKLCEDIYKNISNTTGNTITNTLWLSDSYTYKDNCINDLANKYYAYPFSVDWKKNDSLNLVHDFINKNTNGFIDYTPKYDPDRILLLMNTLFIKDGWKRNGENLDFTKEKYDFINYDNTVKNNYLLDGAYQSGQVATNDVYKMFYTKTSKHLSIDFLVPNDGYTVDDLFKDNIICDAIKTRYSYGTEDVNYYTKVQFPCFSANYEEDICPALKNEGLTFLNEPTRLSKLISDDKDVIIKDIKHVTKLDVNEKGITAAAVTQISGDATSCEPKPEVYDTFLVNKAFAFIIKSESMPLFVGAIKNI